MTMKRKWLIGTAVAVVGVLAWAIPAIGTTSGKGGGPVVQVKVVRGDTAATTTSQAYATLPGATTTVTVPHGQRALILARFSAESNCVDGDPGEYCSVRIRIGNADGLPASGTDFAFDSIRDPSNCSNALFGNNCGWASHSMDRSRGPFRPGTYTVRVQWRVVGATGVPSFRLDDWSLTVERVKVG
jgi:hypothetical protein